jgi:hypothetical protein
VIPSALRPLAIEFMDLPRALSSYMRFNVSIYDVNEFIIKVPLPADIVFTVHVTASVETNNSPAFWVNAKNLPLLYSRICGRLLAIAIGKVLAVHVTASVETATLVLPPADITNLPLPYAIADQRLAEGRVCVVQVTASVDTDTLVLLKVAATNLPSP